MKSPDTSPEMSALIAAERAPFEAELAEVIGQTESLLYRRGNFNGTWDDLICDAIRAEREVEIALSPGVRWGPSLLPGDPITREDIHNATSMTYGACYRTEMTGEMLRAILEDVADNIFNPDPYYQQGGDMVRVGGLGYRIDVSRPIGERISEMVLTDTGAAVEPGRSYSVGGWASVNEGTEGPQIWDILENHIRRLGTVRVEANTSVSVQVAETETGPPITTIALPLARREGDLRTFGGLVRLGLLPPGQYIARAIIAMPGVPREMKRMMADTVLPYLTYRLGHDGVRVIRLEHPQFGDPNRKVGEPFAPGEDEIVFPKSSSSVFVSTHIDYVLRNLGVKQVVLSGLITDQCVESAIRDACDLGYLVTQVTDACLTYSQERHDHSLRTIKGYCRQVTTQELLDELS